MSEASVVVPKLQDLFQVPLFLGNLLDGTGRPLLHGLASACKDLRDLVGGPLLLHVFLGRA